MPLNGVYVFPEKGKNPPPIAEITPPPYQGFPEGLATDSAGNLYVPYLSSENIFVYKSPYTGTKNIIAVIPDEPQLPVAIAVSPAGLIAVLNDNCPFSASCKPSDVQLYKSLKSISTPCATLTDTFHFKTVSYGAFDAKGDLYIDGQNAVNQETYGEIAGGCEAKSIATLPLTVSGGGLQVDRSGNLAIVDSTKKVIDTFDTTRWKKISSTPLNDSAIPVNFAFSKSGKELYTADTDLWVSQEYSYPKGGAAENTLSPGPPNSTFGIAVAPRMKQ